MSRPKILVHPDPRLRVRAASALDRPQADNQALAERLMAALEAEGHGVGIAAPQIGEAVRIVIVDASQSRYPCVNHGRLVMLDPVITRAEGRVLGREGCLSVPDWVGVVPRAERIEVVFFTLAGQRRTICARGFEARVIQHEVDHLDGILFIDRVENPRDLIRRGDAQPARRQRKGRG
ncbi:MAG: peptide deformylase [Zetaproteobacteria bacterium]|nr:MAG: peptide deformylase [Zetaproteobacteria bacterium]